MIKTSNLRDILGAASDAYSSEYLQSLDIVRGAELAPTVTPAEPGVVNIDTATDNTGSQQGNIANGGLTDDLTPTIGGHIDSAEGLAIRIFINTQYAGTAVVDANGDWSFTPGQPLEVNHEYIFQTVIKDPGGDSLLVSLPYTIYTVPTDYDVVIDRPVIDAATDNAGTIVGEVYSGGASDDTTPTFHGSADANAVVRIYDGATLLGSVQANGSGAWSFTPLTPLSGDGTHNITVRASFNSGQEATSDTFEYILDTRGPGSLAITGAYDDVGSVTGNVPDGGVTDDKLLTLSGTAEAGCMVTIHLSVNDGQYTKNYITQADSNGYWTYNMESNPYPSTEGTMVFTATATDNVGNTSTSAPYTVNLVGSNEDNPSVPDAPLIYNYYDDVGASQGVDGNGGTTDDTTPTLNGRAEANSVVRVYDGGTLLGSTIANSSGLWSFTPSTLGDGRHTFTATATDAAGHISAQSGGFVINIYAADTTAPDAPVISNYYDDVGPSQGYDGNGGTTDDTTPTLNGRAEANSVVRVYDGGTLLGSTIANSSGLWSFTPSTLGDGRHTFTATATDAAGHISAQSGGFVINIYAADTTAPDTPVISNYYDDVGPSQGYDGNGGTTDDTTPTLNGRAEANSVVRVYEGSTLLGSTIANSSGEWSFTPSTLGDGRHTFTATATDAAGHVSAQSGGFVVNVQTSSSSFTEDFNCAGTVHFGNCGVYHLNHFDVKVYNAGSCFYSPGFNHYQPAVSQKPGSNAMIFGNGTTVTLHMDHALSSLSFQLGDLTTSECFQVSYLNERGQLLATETYGKASGLLTTVSYTATGGEHIATVQMSLTNSHWWASNSMTYTWVDNIVGHYAPSACAQTFSSVVSPLMQTTTSPDQESNGHSEVSLSQVIQNNHHADLTNHMEDKLQLTLNDILSEAHPNLFVGDGNQQLAITGDKGDVVELKVEDLSHNEWQDVGQVVTGGIQYEIYQHAASSVELLVQHGVELHQVA
ncbi:Ig-like domain-containing protein [Jejubacter calystegiae]|nr:Ig-like domain-containing protein [Jejubacter calystegiae]